MAMIINLMVMKIVLRLEILVSLLLVVMLILSLKIMAVIMQPQVMRFLMAILSISMAAITNSSKKSLADGQFQKHQGKML